MKLKALYISGLTILISLQVLKGQQNNSIYFMDRVPQSHHLNPARQYPCNFYIGAPGLAPLQTTFAHTGFTLNELVYADPNTGVTKFFLHPDVYKVDEFMKSNGKVNYLDAFASVSLASMGVRANHFFISFDVQHKAFVRFSYPKSLLDLALLGNIDENGNSKTIDLKNLGFDYKEYNEIALGISEKINREWTAGFKVKILSGMANINFKNNIDLKTGIDEWSIAETGINIDMSFPPIKIISDSNSNYTGYEEGEIRLQDIKPGNLGAALDFGAIFTPTEKFEFSASVLDLGGINWNSNTVNLTQQSSVSWTGLNFSLDTNQTDPLAALTDSFRFKVTNDPYATPLSTKLFLGGRYFVNEAFSFGILSRNEFYRGRILPQLTLSANINEKFISSCLTYSMMHRTYSNFGFGLSFKIAPFNLYIFSDNIPLRWNNIIDNNGNEIMWPYKQKSFNIRFGMNLIFGCKDPLRDKPLIY
mgnify:CR=1 FL=1